MKSGRKRSFKTQLPIFPFMGIGPVGSLGDKGKEAGSSSTLGGDGYMTPWNNLMDIM